MDVILRINELEIENFDNANKLLSTCIDLIFSANVFCKLYQTIKVKYEVMYELYKGVPR